MEITIYFQNALYYHGAGSIYSRKDATLNYRLAASHSIHTRQHGTQGNTVTPLYLEEQALEYTGQQKNPTQESRTTEQRHCSVWEQQGQAWARVKTRPPRAEPGLQSRPGRLSLRGGSSTPAQQPAGLAPGNPAPNPGAKMPLQTRKHHRSEPLPVSWAQRGSQALGQGQVRLPRWAPRAEWVPGLTSH